MMSYNGDLVKEMKEREWMLLERYLLYHSNIIHHAILTDLHSQTDDTKTTSCIPFLLQ